MNTMISAPANLLKPSFTRDDLARRLGGKPPYRFSRPVSRKITVLKPQLEALLHPRLYYQSKKIDCIKNGAVLLQGDLSFKSVSLSRALKDCQTLICFIATIGGDIDREIARLIRENRSSVAYVLDCMGSVAAESMVEKFQQHMGAQYELEDKGVTYRFSPGYCSWPVTEQKNLFALFDSAKIGITLLDSCLMWPRKSISGVFGVYNDSRKAPYNPCRYCSKKNCNARRQ